jgi:hypothetical protein
VQRALQGGIIAQGFAHGILHVQELFAALSGLGGKHMGLSLGRSCKAQKHGKYPK